MQKVSLCVTLLCTLIFTATGAHAYKETPSFKVSKFQEPGKSRRCFFRSRWPEWGSSFPIACETRARIPGGSGGRGQESAGTSRHFSSPAFPGRPAGPRREAMSSWRLRGPRCHPRVAGSSFPDCLKPQCPNASRPRLTEEGKRRDVLPIFALGAPRPSRQPL